MSRVVRLSVNVNKVATLRNARGGHYPSVVEAARVCVEAGAGGITVHPRQDARHITADDVRAIAELLSDRETRGVEYNVEGDPRPDWLALVREVKPDQATLVPVRPGEVTSEAGWSRDTNPEAMRGVIADLQRLGIRVSLFVDASGDAVSWAKTMGADRVELYTEPFAAAFARSEAEGCAVFARHQAAARRAHELGLGVNAGHDLDLDNLRVYGALPHLAEVSIGHALIGRAVFVGLDRVVREYLDVLATSAT
jgi:pyridoxine 5-phosphate synthase